MMRNIKVVPKKIYSKLVTLWRKIAGYPVIYDALNGQSQGHTKRALLVYLTAPFLDKRRAKPLSTRHTNYWRNLEIAKTLDSLGYMVDVIHFQDIRFQFKVDYDLLIGMGFACSRIVKLMPEGIPKIYIATGSETGFNNEQEMDRIAAVTSRRGCNLKPRRIAKFNSSDLKYFDAVACFGNEFTATTFRKYHDRIYTFNNHGYSDIEYYEKDFEQAKRSFLYFASLGQVHKGLDLLLETFPLQPELHLYICGSFQMESDFVRCYKKELFETPNIHPIGYVEVQERAFKAICEKCAYVIMPSCAEGQSGSVVTCMYAGLIPIVSKECGIDTNAFGLTLKSNEIDEIAKTVKHVANLSAEWHRTQSIKTRQVAVKYYSEEAFTNRWKEILSQNLLIK